MMTQTVIGSVMHTEKENKKKGKVEQNLIGHELDAKSHTRTVSWLLAVTCASGLPRGTHSLHLCRTELSSRTTSVSGTTCPSG